MDFSSVSEGDVTKLKRRFDSAFTGDELIDVVDQL